MAACFDMRGLKAISFDFVAFGGSWATKKVVLEMNLSVRGGQACILILQPAISTLSAGDPVTETIGRLTVLE
jgi:hypothetical protein